jgi:hypothetical protein
MPRIDDRIEQIREQRKGEPENMVTGLVKKGLERIPFAGMAIEYVRGKEKDDKEEFFDNAILDVLADQEISLDQTKAKLEVETVMRVVATAVECIFWGASQKKVKRFAAVVADTIEFDKTEQELDDAASFIRALNELSEMDIKVLDHLYNHQKDLIVEGVESHAFFAGYRMKKILDSTHELGVQVEDFYARCGRLSGYGLVLPLEKPNGTDASMCAFRITRMGKKLIEMLKRGKVTSEEKLGSVVRDSYLELIAGGLEGV